MSHLRDLPRFLWFEPRAPYRLGPGKRDGLLLAVLRAIGLLEGAASPELSWTSASLIVGVALMPTVLWSRSRPLLMVSIPVGAIAALAWHPCRRIRRSPPTCCASSSPRPRALSQTCVRWFAFCREPSPPNSLPTLVSQTSSASPIHPQGDPKSMSTSPRTRVSSRQR